VSAEVVFCIDTKMGIIASIFTSRPTHKKKRELADSLSKMLIIVIIKNPIKADINIINL
jgi:phenylpyruvate tautomerase PptA (4-oxalocrotonate tautomerase family)